MLSTLAMSWSSAFPVLRGRYLHTHAPEKTKWPSLEAHWSTAPKRPTTLTSISKSWAFDGALRSRRWKSAQTSLVFRTYGCSGLMGCSETWLRGIRVGSCIVIEMSMLGVGCAMGTQIKMGPLNILWPMSLRVFYAFMSLQFLTSLKLRSYESKQRFTWSNAFLFFDVLLSFSWLFFSSQALFLSNSFGSSSVTHISNTSCSFSSFN